VILDENESISRDGKPPNEVKVIAKLENEEAIKDIEELLNIADAILIPRGVLGTVLPIEKISWI
jgi:pyruvate kinase